MRFVEMSHFVLVRRYTFAKLFWGQGSPMVIGLATFYWTKTWLNILSLYLLFHHYLSAYLISVIVTHTFDIDDVFSFIMT